MSVTPDKSALAQARERLEKLVTAVVEQGRDAGLVAISPTRLHWSDCASDLRLVLDALRDADERFIATAINTFRDVRDCHITGAPTPDQVNCFSVLIRERVTGQRAPARDPRAALAAKEQP